MKAGVWNYEDPGGRPPPPPLEKGLTVKVHNQTFHGQLIGNHLDR